MKDQDWRIIDVLHRTLSLNKAAEILYTTQPSLTKRLKNIEDELGVVIAQRTAKGLTFKVHGEYIAKKAAEYLQWRTLLDKDLKAIDDGYHGTLKIGSAFLYALLRG